ncbi:MAG: hypothetical protein ABI379_09255 [Rhodanobacter sp.]
MRGLHAFSLFCVLTGGALLSLTGDAHAHAGTDTPLKRVTAADLAQDKALLGFQRDLVSVLALRADPQPLLAAALLARPLPAQPKALGFHALIERAAAAHGAGPAITWVRLADCDPAPEKCPNPDARDALLQQASGNAAVWLLKLGGDVGAQESAAARQDLARAAAATSYDDYAGAGLQALAAAVGTLPPPTATRNPAYAAGAAATQVMLVFGLGQTLPQPALQVVARFCEGEKEDTTVKSDCLKLGKNLEWGSSPLARALGLHLRETLATDPAEQTDAAHARVDLAWQVQNFAEISARALNDTAVAQHLLTLARNGGTEMSLMLAALRDNHVSIDAPPGWSPPAKP